ncbi:MAG: tyrosine-type recombinase/integrase, partial [Desulfuromonadaceae bacterium]
ALRYSRAGKQIEEGLGWSSEGWTLKRAQTQLGELQKAADSGEGPTSLREKRAAVQAERVARERAESEAARQAHEEAERRRREEITLAEFWPRYWSDAVEGANKPTTRDEKHRMWETQIKPKLGHMPVKDITDGDVSDLIRSVQKVDKAGNVTHGKAEAANIYRLLRHVFNKALAWKVRPIAAGNPVKTFGIEPKVKRRERLLSDSEIAALLRELDRSWTDGAETPSMCAALTLCVLMGFRANEAATLRHDYIRRDLEEIHLPETKSGHSVRPLPPAVIAVLDRLGRVAVGSPWVFPAARDSKAPLPYNSLDKAARRLGQRAGVEGFHLHQLRHRFATVIANAEPNPRVGMALTGHKSYAAFVRYIHSDRDRAKELAAKLGDVTAALGAQHRPEGEKVIPLPTRRRSEGKK